MKMRNNMNKYLSVIVVMLAGCGQMSSSKLSTSDLIKAEGFTAYSVAVYKRDTPTPTPVKEVEQPVAVVTEVAKDPKVIKTPKKYLRLLSAEKGCGPCIHQDQIITGSDWQIHSGPESKNEDKIPYHGIHERVESLNDVNNPLWSKYNAKSVPHWDLIVDGKIVKTFEGVMNLNQLREFYGDK